MENSLKMNKLLIIAWIYTNVACVILCQNSTTNNDTTNNRSSLKGSNGTTINAPLHASTVAENMLNKHESSITNGFTLKMPSGLSLGTLSENSLAKHIQIEETGTPKDPVFFTETGQAVLDLTVLESNTASTNDVNGNNGAFDQVGNTSEVSNTLYALNETTAGNYEAMVGTDQLHNTEAYVSLEKLSRQKRQSGASPDLPLQNRVLLLTNNNNNGTGNQRLDGRVIMLRPNTTGLGMGPNVNMRLKPRDSLFDVFRGNNRNLETPQLSEVARSLPAIQRITDLNNIELPLISSEFAHANTSSNSSNNTSNTRSNSAQRLNNIQSHNSQSSRSTNTRNATSTNHQEGSSTRRNIVHQTRLPNRQQNTRQPTRQSTRQPTRLPTRQPTRQQNTRHSAPTRQQNTRHSAPTRQQNTRQGTPTRQLVALRRSQSQGARIPTQNRLSTNTGGRNNIPTSRQTSSNSLSRQIRPVQPRLTVQQPVSSRRITSRPASSSRPSSSGSSSSSRSASRPLVRTVSSQAVRQRAQQQQQQLQRARAIRPQQRASTVRRQPRRQVRRRRPSPPDPFTRRFAAGFQRGSNLLNQPPLDFNGFDGTQRDNVGFNGLGPNELGLPGPLLTQPRIFGGLGLPGFGFGPTMI